MSRVEGVVEYQLRGAQAEEAREEAEGAVEEAAGRVAGRVAGGDRREASE